MGNEKVKKSHRSFAGKALLLSLIVAILVACTDKTGGKEAEIQDKGAMETYAVGDAFKATEPFDLSILYSDQPAYPYKQDWMLLLK